MSRGNEIIVSANPRGVFMEGVIASGETPKPGVAMQIQAATALVGGRHTFEMYNVAADGSRPNGPIYLLLPDHLQGRTAETAYAAGDRAFLYTPLPGEEFNLRIGGSVVSGTATIAKGTVLIPDDGTGLFIPTASTPEIECAMTLEATTDANTDVLTWAVWSGY